MDLAEHLRNNEQPERHGLAAYGAAPLRMAAGQSGARMRAEQFALSRQLRDRFAAEVVGAASPPPAAGAMLILAAGTPGAPAPDDGADWLEIAVSGAESVLDAAATVSLDRAAALHHARRPIVLRVSFPHAGSPELHTAQVMDGLVERGVPRQRLQVLAACPARETVF